MTWAEFRSACETLLTVDGSSSRQTIGGFNAILLRNGVSDLQRFIPQLKSNQRNTWRVGDLAQEGETSVGALPDKARAREAFIIRKTCPCTIFPLVPYQWEYRFDLICDKPRRHEWPFYISIDPSATEFMVYPKIKEDDELWIFWDGFKTDFADGDPVRLGEEEALAVSYYIKAHITREVDKDLALKRDYWQSYAGAPGVMGLRTKLFLDWKERGEILRPQRPPDASCSPCTPCASLDCCWDYSCATGGFSQGFWYLKHPTTGSWHKITVTEETGDLTIKIHGGIANDCIEFDDCLSAAGKGYKFSGGYFHLLNESTGKFIALSVIGAPGEEMLKLEPPKGVIGHISTTAFGFRLETCLELRNLDDSCNRNTWHAISLVDMGAPQLSVSAGDCVICPPSETPEEPGPSGFLSAQQTVSCEESGDLTATITLPPYLSISGGSLIMAAAYESDPDSQAAADAKAAAALQTYFEAGLASGDLVCPEPPIQPPSVPNACGAWWKADSFSLPDGTPVGGPSNEWIDSSGNGRNLNQSTASAQPLFRTNIFGTMPAVQFDGVNDSLNIGIFPVGGLNFTTQLGSPSNECTIFMLFKQLVAADNAPILIEGTSSTQMLAQGAANTMRAWDGQGFVATSAVLTIPPTDPRVIIFRNKAGVANNVFRENKTNKGPVSQSNLGFDFRKVGAGADQYPPTTTLLFAGYIAEIIAFCASFTDAECDDFYDNYFRQKYVGVLPP